MKTNKNNTDNRHGISTIEMMAGVTVLVIIVLSITGILAQNQNIWNTMYDKTYSERCTAGQNAKKMFDSIIRRSSKDNLLIDGNGNWVEARYYANDASVQIDRYTLFSYDSGALSVEQGQISPSQVLSSFTICDNVTDCVFKQSGDSVYMLLTIDVGTHTQLIGSSAKMQN